MKTLSSKAIRQIWLDFWAEKQHKILASKSLVPANDPSLLWINSGVATLKAYFSGQKIPPAPRLANSQKSLRTNDIENVGVTARHHTFFEMLGNFSIGDYFKKEAITWAYELLTQHYNLSPEKLYFTYYGEDLATYQLWKGLGVDETHLIKGTRETNFWDVGQGPCGPDTEIFYDRGERFDPDKKGLELLIKDLENDRYLEIWNIVFSQYNNDGQNNYQELAQKNIDTGSGLERLVAILQDGPTNFDTDLFLPIIHQLETLTSIKYQGTNYFKNDPSIKRTNRHFKIIADHLRAVTMAIEDGVKPSNLSRGYIIRRLIRRAYRSGMQLGIKASSFLYQLVPTVAQILDIYPVNIQRVSAIIQQEELAFAKTIQQGEELLQKALANHTVTFEFATAFKLFETYGFPLELTQEILAEKNIKLDLKQLAAFKKAHADVSRATKNHGMQSQIQVIQEIAALKSVFTGYEKLAQNATVLFSAMEHDKAYTLLDKTPFYPTGGGQQADLGYIDDAKVLDVFKDKYGNIWHVTDCVLSGQVKAQVDPKIRLRKAANHSATHLLGAALRQVFGPEVKQLGSDNNEHRLRFDFPLARRAEPEKLAAVETIVNGWIQADLKRDYILTNFKKGQEMGAIALENEDYGDQVRVVKFAQIIEFCGGTHVSSTKQIEAFKIIKFESKGSGIFRIEAITTHEKVQQFLTEQVQKLQKQVQAICAKIKVLKPDFTYQISHSVKDLTADLAQLQIVFKKLKQTQNNAVMPNKVEVRMIQGQKVHLKFGLSPAQVKNYVLQVRNNYPDIIVIGIAQNEAKQIVAVGSIDLDAKAYFDQLAQKFNGRGGGNADFAMGTMDQVNL